ncbi:integrase core domain-containing protein, partial [Thiotrichales bacterium 19S3-11]|nr:integrase core domain-containing protein [Thiotrichales bacterium 19S3-11]
TSSCLEALEMALTKGKAEIINSDQGCQFTSNQWTEALVKNNIKISMTGKGRCLDNVYIERFWRSLKQEKIKLSEFSNLKELEGLIKDYIEHYNHKRPHQALGNYVPYEVYKGLNKLPMKKV